MDGGAAGEQQLHGRGVVVREGVPHAVACPEKRRFLLAIIILNYYYNKGYRTQFSASQNAVIIGNLLLLIINFFTITIIRGTAHSCLPAKCRLIFLIIIFVYYYDKTYRYYRTQLPALRNCFFFFFGFVVVK